MKLPATLKPENVTALIDTREQQLLDLSPLRTEQATLPTGDYSVKGLEHVVAIERKSLDDLLGCVGRDRERFDREVQRLLAYPVRVLLVEATWAQIELGQWRSKLTPESVIGSLLGWQAIGLAVHMVGDHERAGRQHECCLPLPSDAIESCVHCVSIRPRSQANDMAARTQTIQATEGS